MDKSVAAVTASSSTARYPVLSWVQCCLCAPPPFPSRRAVSEHQLMHDRGRSIQSLKRLIWLSGAIEGLHTPSPNWLFRATSDHIWIQRVELKELEMSYS
uniref:Parathyroid hormone 2 n=1 Tax=Sphaeramia orbicularis TaxID=375764 RepID=A0A672ZYZ7_9TELE